MLRYTIHKLSDIGATLRSTGSKVDAYNVARWSINVGFDASPLRVGDVCEMTASGSINRVATVAQAAKTVRLVRC